MKKTEFNINDKVWVKMKPLGEKIICVYYRMDEYPEWLKPNKDGYVKFQLHSLMNIFGEHIRLGSDPPFETDILLEAR